ncbi:MAG: type 1 glutamine amidotransferase [Polyangiaceae bacterium]
MQVLVVQHVEGEGSAAIGETLRGRRIEERVVRVDRGDSVPVDLADARGLLVMGGPMGVYEADRFPHLRDEIRLIQRAVSVGVPVLGVCLGSQLVAAALGARVTRAAKREIGWRDVRLRDAARDDRLWKGSPPSFAPLHWHGDVFDLPGKAVSLASSKETEHQAFRFGDKTWGLLFHLEMRPADVETMATRFAEDLTAAGLRREDVVGTAEERTAALAPIVEKVFGAWADLVRAT